MFEVTWDDGSGDKIYFNPQYVQETGGVLVTSDENRTGVERRKTIYFSETLFRTEEHDTKAYLTIVQTPDSKLYY